jgi:casein kinase I family protein HRR25
MATYMNYCRNLGFEETPNYTFLRRLFKDLYNKCCFENDFVFDWTIQRYRVEFKSQNYIDADGKSQSQDSLKGNV